MNIHKEIIVLYIGILIACLVAFAVGLYFRQWLVAAAAAAAALVGGLIMSIMIVEPGNVDFLKTFGTLSQQTYEADLHLVNPFSDRLTQNIRRRSINYTGESTVEGLTKNKVALLVDVTVPWIINPKAAPLLYERYGENWNLIGPSSRKAIRDCTATMDWEQAVSEAGREAMVTCIPARLAAAVTSDLIQAGFTEAEAENAFLFPSALVRKMIPKEKRILAAVAEEQAAVVDLRRQQTLTKIAREEANRRANEGSGIRLMMAELPKEYSVADMVSMIRANAAKTNAEAFMKAVETGNTNITVITGDNGVPVAARAN